MNIKVAAFTVSEKSIRTIDPKVNGNSRDTMENVKYLWACVSGFSLSDHFITLKPF